MMHHVWIKNYNTEYIVYNKLDLWFKTIPEMELV